MVQQLIVAFIVAGAALYAAWTLMPAAARRRLAALAARQLGRMGADSGMAQRVEAALAASSGCSECSSCKGCAAPATPPGPRVATIALPEKFAGRRKA
jgi:hypothetical protein